MDKYSYLLMTMVRESKSSGINWMIAKALTDFPRAFWKSRFRLTETRIAYGLVRTTGPETTA